MRILLCSCLLVAAALAQDYRAGIVGRVTDPSGAAVAGARILVTNLETNATNSATTAETGDYVVPALQPGRYKLMVEQAGFKTYVQQGITLKIQDRVAVDVKLELGDLASSVSVTAEASPLETATASRGEVITGRTLVDLPLNGRNAFALAALTPGVNSTARGQSGTFLRTSSNGGITAMVISGGQPRFNEALLDGVPNTGSDGTIQFVPSVDAAQEFKVQTNIFDAEFGRFTGGLINASTKPGTNEVHGSLFEFVRNSALNARDPFATTIPQFGYNQFGGSAGAPVFLPKLYNGRNRTFFFFNYEGSREGVPRAYVNTVPTARQRQGDFSQTSVRLGTGQTAAVTIYDPATTKQVGSSFVRDPFPENRIPANRFDPVARNMLALYPAANAPGDAITGASNFLMSYKDPVRDDSFIVRIDHRISERHQLFGRFSRRHFYVARQGQFKNSVTGDSENRYTPGAVLDYIFLLNPATVVNFRYGFSRYLSRIASDNLGYDATQLGFPASLVRALPIVALPKVDIAGFNSLASPENVKLSRNAEDSHTWRAGLTRMAGRQTLRFGGEARLLRSNVASPGDAAGAYKFDAVFTRGPNPQASTVTGGSGLASFLLGLGASGGVASNAAPAGQAPYYGFYFQDDFRVTSKLTLNLGLRYEWEGPNTERYNRFNRGYAFGVPSPLEEPARANYAQSPIPEVPLAQFHVTGGLLFTGVAGQPRGLTNLDRNNAAPRVGAAYSLTPKTVLRGGWGLFYGPTTLLSETTQGFSVTTSFVGSLDGGLTPANTLSDPFPGGLLSPAGASQGLLTLVGQNITFVTLGRQQPYTHQYQFGVQRELPGQMLLEAAYSGSSGRDLPVNRQLNALTAQARDQARATFLATGRNVLNDAVANPFNGLISSGALSSKNTTRKQLMLPYPQFPSLQQLNGSIGLSRYDSFQMKVRRRFAQGLSMLVSYAVAKELDRTRFLNDEDTSPVRELAEFDVPQHLVVSGAYELPLGRSRKYFAGATGVAGRLLEGYQVNVIYTAQSGFPILVDGVSLGHSAKLPSDQRRVGRWFDTSAFRQRQTLEPVATSRLPDVRSAGKNNFDLSLFKTTTITERARLQVRAEAFNALNHPEYFAPGGTVGSSTFGVITRTNTFARQLQFGLKLLW